MAKQPADRPGTWGEIADALTVIYKDVTGAPPMLEITGPALEARELMDKGYSLTELGRMSEASKPTTAPSACSRITPGRGRARADAAPAGPLRRSARVLRRSAANSAALRLGVEGARAWCWNASAELEEALECYETAAEIDPDDVWNWYNQADVLHNLGHDAEAITTLEKALEVDPAHPNSWAKLGQIYRVQGDTAEAIHAYEQAIRLDPQYRGRTTATA